MEEQVKTEKKTRRKFTKEERRAMYEAEIAKCEARIAELKEKIAALDAPVVTAKELRDKIKEYGFSNEEVLKLIEKAMRKG